MNRLRVGALLTLLLGLMWAAIGLFDSLHQIGVGLVVASLGCMAYGLVDYVEGRRDELCLGREAVWVRRDR